ncbi:MAG TPA: cupredoxin domain-containing protein [Planctomycetota bacterium]|nr:cupredoxin domain-containing protein [Planctomycetota bacterium]
MSSLPALLSALAVLALSGPARALAPQAAAEEADRWGPNPVASLHGGRVDTLFWLITLLVGVSFLIVLVMLLVTLLRDRARPGVKARYDAGSSLHDKRFTAIVSVVVFLLLDASVLWVTMHDLRETVWNFPAPSEDAVRVELLAQQWAWNFRLTGADGEFGTADDIVTINQVHVPQGRPVVVHGTSKDVIHSLFIPDMRIKRDLNPGALNSVWFQPEKAGDFEILCAELCGFAHYQMHGRLSVVPTERWEAWQAEASRIAQATHDEQDTEARWAWDWKE